MKLTYETSSVAFHLFYMALSVDAMYRHGLYNKVSHECLAEERKDNAIL